MTGCHLYLASASPRRQEILKQIGVLFAQIVVDVDEELVESESSEENCCRISQRKARAGFDQVSQCDGYAGEPVLGADTMVVCDNVILGKPANEEEGGAMLKLLSGREHQVITAVTMVSPNQLQTIVSESRVFFRTIDEAESRKYWRTGEPEDKAGGYGIQGLGAVFVSSLEGSYSGVVGLPIFETTQLLQAFNVPWWSGDA